MSHTPFLFVVYALYPFAVINHRHEYNYMLSPPSESLPWGLSTQTSFNFNQSLLLVPPGLAQQTPVNRVVTGAGPKSRSFYSPRMILLLPTGKLSNLTATENNAEPPVQHNPDGDHTATGPLLLRKWFWQRSAIFKYEFTFPASNALASTMISECLVH